MEYLAHYERKTGHKQLLKEHLINVGTVCRNRVSPMVSFENITNDTVKEVAYTVGVFHDIGKYTTFFQDHLKYAKASSYSQHAHISAIYIYIALQNRIQKVSDEEKQVILLIAYLCARFHHNALTVDIEIVDKSKNKKMWKMLQIQWDNLLKNKSQIAVDLWELGEGEIEENIEKLKEAEKIIKHNALFETAWELSSGNMKDPKWFFILIYVFSLLIDSDKMDSAEVKMEETKTISPIQVENYLSTKEKAYDLADKREKARKTILNSMNNLTEEELREVRFFTLTAPTGIGKTLASLQAALTLQEKISKIEHHTSRLIAVIPFVNIIEQNKSEYANVLGTYGRLIVHHRLNDFSQLKPRGKNLPVDKKLMEVESWEGDLVLTTFVQLFQSIFTGKNRLLKKIHKLAGSIVILDEAQAIPEAYMPVVGALLIKLSEYLGTRFILMTATQPRILDFGKLLIKDANIKEIKLLPDYESYFSQLTRTKLIPILDKELNQDEFIKLFFQKWQQNQSVLIVVNTIKRSIGIFNEIKKQLIAKEIDVPIYYLSTNIVPLQRGIVIKEVREALKNRPVILVSTQTIEAGVDLDFHMAFRDFAPLDSIIQTAGRVNREGKKGEYSPVYIVKVEKDSSHVYDLMLRSDTLEMMLQQEEIYEGNYGVLAEKYYDNALERGASDTSSKLWKEGILQLDFNALEEFKLIDTEAAEDVFVELNEEATRTADLYEKVFKREVVTMEDLKNVFGKKESLEEFIHELDNYRRKTLLKLISTKISNYIIQVRINQLKKNRPIEFSARGDAYSEMYWIPKTQLKDYYDEETGFKAENLEAYLY
ncbi:CRISPR-associated helicase Cas3 [Clostridium aceticum]|uniref:CRISPR-associated helicase Cas3 n=1 Tax=Clostridium aceticum TaxID=84022 RepID=A0A0D8ID74_9CLOT|nr:CRISPR-associated helicase/endonuclease Cas3 [Clostridium aceticum]AKL94555.1 CRISPR-associated helicase Cas3 [Clostridium aceticum]KJF28243.1 hypothetical protein TZ02_02355 [Clostridium aceticum]